MEDNIYLRIALGTVVGIVAVYIGYGWVQEKQEEQRRVEAELQELIQPMAEEKMNDIREGNYNPETEIDNTVQENSASNESTAVNDVIVSDKSNSEKTKQELREDTQGNIQKIQTARSDFDNILYIDYARGDAGLAKAINKTSVGVCEEEDVKESLAKIDGTCRDGTGGFVVYAQNSDGSYECGDATGFPDGDVWAEPVGLSCGVQ